MTDLKKDFEKFLDNLDKKEIENVRTENNESNDE